MDRDPIIKALHQARLDQNLTQAELAERIGVRRNLIAMWEGDRATPPLPKLRRWAVALGYKITLTPDADAVVAGGAGTGPMKRPGVFETVFREPPRAHEGGEW